MRILVTGGSGFIGKPLVRALTANGHKVVIFAREDDIDRPDSAELIQGNIIDKITLRKAFSSVEVVYHLAASMNEDDASMWETNVKGTEKVVELCREKKVRQLIFMSSAGVLGDTHSPAKESSPYNPKTEFERSKAEAEKIIRHSGVTYTIVRAPVVIGPSPEWWRFFEAIKAGHPIIGRGKNNFHIVHVDDVVGMLLAVMNKKAYDHIFHVACKDVMTYEDVYKLAMKEMKIEAKERYMHPGIAGLLSRVHWITNAVQAKQPKSHMSKSHINMVTRECALSVQKAKDLLGFEPLYTTPEAVHQTFVDLKR